MFDERLAEEYGWDWDALWEEALEQDPNALLRYTLLLLDHAEELMREGRPVKKELLLELEVRLLGLKRSFAETQEYSQTQNERR